MFLSTEGFGVENGVASKRGVNYTKSSSCGVRLSCANGIYLTELRAELNA